MRRGNQQKTSYRGRLSRNNAGLPGKFQPIWQPYNSLTPFANCTCIGSRFGKFLPPSPPLKEQRLVESKSVQLEVPSHFGDSATHEYAALLRWRLTQSQQEPEP